MQKVYVVVQNTWVIEDPNSVGHWSRSVRNVYESEIAALEAVVKLNRWRDSVTCFTIEEHTFVNAL